MLRCGLDLILALGLLVPACGHAPPAAGSSRPAADSIAWPSRLDHASTPATHRDAALELLRASGVAAAMGSMTEVALRQQLELNPIIKPYEGVLREFLLKYMSFDALRDDFLKLYMERFDELQLRQMTAFYETPTGKRATRELAALYEAGAEIGKRKVEEHMSELQDKIRAAAKP